MTSAGPATAAPPSRLDDEDLASLLLIRQFELAVLELFGRGMLSGTTHTCIGQEHIPVALSRLLRPGDYVFSNHRGHGHYLARFGDPEGLLAEIMGRAGAVCGGVGGSQHIYRDGYLSTGVQGQTVPVAAGTALHLARLGQQGLSCVYIGDGTWGEGAVYEALNLAALWRLPLVVVVEHNGIAQSTPAAVHLAGSIAARAAAFGIAHHWSDSDDVRLIRDQVGGLLRQARLGAGPLVLEFATQRLGPHSKGGDDPPLDAAALAAAGDWAARYACEYPDQFAAEEARQNGRIANLVAAVEARPLAGRRPR
jgi:acetoin:2,6-dichlorophenolindophenol oxidoreductase subunit alpha